jgi:hypothetical protein
MLCNNIYENTGMAATGYFMNQYEANKLVQKAE